MQKCELCSNQAVADAMIQDGSWKHLCEMHFHYGLIGAFIIERKCNKCIRMTRRLRKGSSVCGLCIK